MPNNSTSFICDAEWWAGYQHCFDICMITFGQLCGDTPDSSCGWYVTCQTSCGYVEALAEQCKEEENKKMVVMVAMGLLAFSLIN